MLKVINVKDVPNTSNCCADNFLKCADSRSRPTKHTVDTGAADLEPGCDGGRAYALAVESAHGCAVYGRLAAFVDAFGLRPGDPLGLALAPQVGLEFGKDAEHVEEGLAGGGGRVDRLLRRAQRSAFPPQLAHDVLQVADRTGEPVDSPKDPSAARRYRKTQA